MWRGYGYITTPEVDLFAEAAVAPDRHAYWEEEDDAAEYEEDRDEDEDADADDEDIELDDEGSFASRDLELHLPEELINEVHARLRAFYPEYAAATNRPATSLDLT